MATAGIRRTVQGEAVRGALEASDGFVSALELHRRLGDDGMKIGIATVYRQLGALVSAEQADTIMTATGQLYRACADPAAHHHHLVCERCGTAIEIEPPDEAWFRSVADAHGFTLSHHTFEVFGVCAGCRAAEAAEGGAAQA